MELSRVYFVYERPNGKCSYSEYMSTTDAIFDIINRLPDNKAAPLFDRWLDGGYDEEEIVEEAIALGDWRCAHLVVKGEDLLRIRDIYPQFRGVVSQIMKLEDIEE